MTLADRVSRQIKRDAEDFNHVPRLTVNECELAAEVQRLNAENAGQRVALEVLGRGQDVAKDMQAVRDCCADQIKAAIEDTSGRQDLLNKLTDLVLSMRARR